MHTLQTYWKSWHAAVIKPRSTTVDDQRRELIVNILLCGLSVISLVALLNTAANHLFGPADGYNSLPLVFGFTVTMLGLWKVSRMGHFHLVSYLLLAFVLIGATQLTLLYSFELQVAELLFALAIVMAGVLLPADIAVKVDMGVVTYVLGLSYAQTTGTLHPDLRWSGEHPTFGDAIGMSVLLATIGLVSWLANREIDRALNRAHASEAALARERDSLEVKVAERTRELEQAQLERVMELQRLAEFGRLSAGFIHEVANPLTVASLNIEQLSSEPRPVLIRQAAKSLQHIERYIEAARKQLRGQGDMTAFSPQHEIRQVMSILRHHAPEAGIKLELVSRTKQQLFGDAVKFSQLMANLLTNAIEAYEGTPAAHPNKRVIVTVDSTPASMVITVQDWGKGLPKGERDQIFKPFFSTKTHRQQNMGIGLAMVEEIVKKDFGGSISVTSSPARGTCFTVRLRRHER